MSSNESKQNGKKLEKASTGFFTSGQSKRGTSQINVFSLEKRTNQDKQMVCLMNNEGSVTSHSSEMRRLADDFYSKLYTVQDSVLQSRAELPESLKAYTCSTTGPWSCITIWGSYKSCTRTFYTPDPWTSLQVLHVTLRCCFKRLIQNARELYTDWLLS